MVRVNKSLAERSDQGSRWVDWVRVRVKVVRVRRIRVKEMCSLRPK